LPSKLRDEYSKKLLTQAFYRHIIGVASEQKKCTEAKKNKNKNSNKKLHKKRPFLAGGRFYFTHHGAKYQQKYPTNITSGIFVGGAGGYCPRVQMVTYYSSTNIVYSGFYYALRILGINKHDLLRAQ